MVNLVFWYDVWSRPCTLGHTRGRLAGLDRPVRDARGLEMPLVLEDHGLSVTFTVRLYVDEL